MLISKKFKKQSMLTAAAVGLSLSMGAVQAAVWDVTQDTSVYEFLGNLGAGTGDSNGITVWNHESNHGTKGLLQFDSAWTTDAVLAGDFQATLNLYQVCEPGGFVGACAGDAGAEVVNTDVLLQGSNWNEAGAISWGNIAESSTPYATITQTSNSNGWVSIDITDLVGAWLLGDGDYGLALSQENYDVIRAASGSVAVAKFCDSESANGVCATGDFTPYLEISAVPLPGAAWLLISGLIGFAGFSRGSVPVLAS